MTPACGRPCIRSCGCGMPRSARRPSIYRRPSPVDGRGYGPSSPVHVLGGPKAQSRRAEGWITRPDTGQRCRTSSPAGHTPGGSLRPEVGSGTPLRRRRGGQAAPGFGLFGSTPFTAPFAPLFQPFSGYRIRDGPDTAQLVGAGDESLVAEPAHVGFIHACSPGDLLRAPWTVWCSHPPPLWQNLSRPRDYNTIWCEDQTHCAPWISPGTRHDETMKRRSSQA